MILRRPEPGVLRLRARRWELVGGVLLAAVVVSIVCVLLPRGLPDDPEWQPIKLGLYFAPLLALPAIIRSFDLLMTAETIEFRADTAEITKNGRRLVRFADVDRVQVREIEDSEERDRYRLSIALKNGDKMRICQSGNRDWIFEAADDIADLVGVEVVQKSSEPRFSLFKEILSGDGGLTSQERRTKADLEQKLGRNLEDWELTSLKTRLEAEEVTDGSSSDQERKPRK